MIVLRSPKGWTGPKMVDGKQAEGTFRSHQVPMGEMSQAGPRQGPGEMAEELPPAGAVRQDGQADRPSSRRSRRQGSGE